MNFLLKLLTWLGFALLALILIPFFLVILLVFSIIWLFSSSKCDYYKKCPHYEEDSVVCNEDCGMYYAWDKPAGCYYQMAEREKQERKEKEDKKKKKCQEKKK